MKPKPSQVGRKGSSAGRPAQSKKPTRARAGRRAGPRQPKEFKLVSLRECRVFDDQPILDTPKVAADYWRRQVATEARFNPHAESLVLLMLNRRLRLLGHVVLSQGTKDTLLFNAGEVLRAAVVAGAAAVLLMHNHPSGNPFPSPADISATTSLLKASKMLDIELFDHVIMGKASRTSKRDYVSLRALGYFSELKEAPAETEQKAAEQTQAAAQPQKPPRGRAKPCDPKQLAALKGLFGRGMMAELQQCAGWEKTDVYSYVGNALGFQVYQDQMRRKHCPQGGRTMAVPLEWDWDNRLSRLCPKAVDEIAFRRALVAKAVADEEGRQAAARAEVVTRQSSPGAEPPAGTRAATERETIPLAAPSLLSLESDIYEAMTVVTVLAAGLGDHYRQRVTGGDSITCGLGTLSSDLAEDIEAGWNTALEEERRGVANGEAQERLRSHLMAAAGFVSATCAALGAQAMFNDGENGQKLPPAFGALAERVEGRLLKMAAALGRPAREQAPARPSEKATLAA